MRVLKKNSRRPVVLIGAGEGGHYEQAKVLCDLLKQQSVYFDFHYENQSNMVPKVSALSKRNKLLFTVAALKTIIYIPLTMLRFKKLKKDNEISALICFGPLCCIPMILVALVFKVPVIFIESWSRFEKLSLTGNLCKNLSCSVFSQNKIVHKDFEIDHIGRLG